MNYNIFDHHLLSFPMVSLTQAHQVNKWQGRSEVRLKVGRGLARAFIGWMIASF
jgi:hypothetical protein